MKKAQVFAVDVGYGNTKCAFRMGSDLATMMFPSLAPLRLSEAVSSFAHGVLSDRKVAAIEIDGTVYEVGPGVERSSAYGNAGRTLSEDFCTTPNYAALLYGAIHFAGVNDVERLVLGLPVHSIGKYADFVRDAFSGTLIFGEHKVRVGSVKVIPQPLGSLVSFSEYGGDEFDRENEHIVIDVGYFTTDWVVANGFTMNDARSGGVPGGASQVYKRIASLISEARGEIVTDIEKLDKCLRMRKPFLFYNQEMDLEPYVEKSQAVVRSTVKAIQEKVGATGTVRSIVLSGGGAALYESAVREAFPKNRVQLMDAPCFANAKGFLIIGESTLARERKLGVAA